MKIAPNYERGRWKNIRALLLTYPKHKPPKRLLRNHFKNVSNLTKRLKEDGHNIKSWKYWYGQSVSYCLHCNTYFYIKLGNNKVTTYNMTGQVK